MKLPAPIIEKIEGDRFILRDDLLPGGTKRRALPAVLKCADSFVYAGPVYGYAQVAIAFACADLGKTATVFIAKRRALHPRTLAAKVAGAQIVEVSPGYLTVVCSRARAYAAATGAYFLPFGIDDRTFIFALAAIARALPIRPVEIWTVAGSGTLSRALQLAWPSVRFFAVQIGKPPDYGRAELLIAPERFEADAEIQPPFPSCSNYDAKAWRFFSRQAAPGALFWNVAA